MRLYSLRFNPKLFFFSPIVYINVVTDVQYIKLYIVLSNRSGFLPNWVDALSFFPSLKFPAFKVMICVFRESGKRGREKINPILNRKVRAWKPLFVTRLEGWNRFCRSDFAPAKLCSFLDPLFPFLARTNPFSCFHTFSMQLMSFSANSSRYVCCVIVVNPTSPSSLGTCSSEGAIAATVLLFWNFFSPPSDIFLISMRRIAYTLTRAGGRRGRMFDASRRAAFRIKATRECALAPFSCFYFVRNCETSVRFWTLMSIMQKKKTKNKKQHTFFPTNL